MAEDRAVELGSNGLPSLEIWRLYLVKTVAGVCIVTLAWGARRFVTPAIPATAALAVILPSLVPALLVIAFRGRVGQILLGLSFLGDVVAVSMAVHLGGGADMLSGPMAYAVTVVLAVMVLSARAAVWTALGSSLGYGLVLWAEYAGKVADYGFGMRPPDRKLAAFVAVSAALFVMAALVSYAARQVREFSERAQAARSAAVGGLSRRLREPLRVIRGYAQLVENAGEEERAEFLRRILQWSQRAVDIVNNVLDASRLERHPLMPRRESVGVDSLLEEAAGPYRPAAEVRGIRLFQTCPAELPALSADRRLLVRALGNLIGNALWHTPSGGSVEVKAGDVQGTVHLTVADDGPGMAPAAREHLARAGAEIDGEAVVAGRGLGLALAGAVASAHGGALRVESGDGGGCRCTLELAGQLCPASRATRRRRRAPVRRVAALSGPEVRRILRGKAMAFLAAWVIGWGVSRWLVPEVLIAQASLVLLADVLLTLAVTFRPREVPVWALGLCFAADVVTLTALIHLGGGVEVSAGPMLYIILIGLAGLTVSERAAFGTAVLSALAYTALVGLEHAGVLVHRVPYLRPPEYEAMAVILVVGSLVLGAWVVSYGVRQVRAIYELADDLRGEAVGALAHDLKNPLAVVVGHAQMMGEGVTAEGSDGPRRMQHAAQQALDLVDNALDAAGAEGQLVTPNVEPLRVNDLVAQVVEVYRLTAAGKGVRLVCDLAASIPVGHADRHLLTRAVANLLSNGIKFTKRGGTVEVKTEAGEGVLRIVVCDSGCGIAASDQARLFQAYNRAASSRGVEGTGLGLYIVRTVAEAHGGVVRLSSAAGEGSRFTIELPIRAA